MDILLVHNHYQQAGGEDGVFASEARSLAVHGHRVILHEAFNETIRSRVGVALRTAWNHRAYREMRALIRKERPQLLHAHNTFPLLSPSIYYAARAEQVPVVQTLHNYRLLCPNALLFRDGQVCQECTSSRVLWPAIRHACYQGSATGTAVISTMLGFHRWLGTWNRVVDAYIVPTDFGRRMFLQAGLPPHKVFVKPNFAEDPFVNLEPARRRKAVFVGRLAPEKGVETMLQAWRQLGGSVPLHIIGDGPLAELVKRFASEVPSVFFHGWLDKPAVLEVLRDAAFLVMPSTWYEVFGMNVIEAYSCGVPVIASRIGGLADIVSDGVTGLHFAPGDSAELAEKVRWALSHPVEWEQIGRRARMEFQLRYTDGPAYNILMQVYRAAIGRSSEASLDVRVATPSPGVRLIPAGRFRPSGHPA